MAKSGGGSVRGVPTEGIGATAGLQPLVSEGLGATAGLTPIAGVMGQGTSHCVFCHDSDCPWAVTDVARQVPKDLGGSRRLVGSLASAASGHGQGAAQILHMPEHMLPRCDEVAIQEDRAQQGVNENTPVRYPFCEDVFVCGFRLEPIAADGCVKSSRKLGRSFHNAERARFMCCIEQRCRLPQSCSRS